jgi:hypothetical protein
MHEKRSDFTWLAVTKPMEPAEPSKNDDAKKMELQKSSRASQ